MILTLAPNGLTSTARAALNVAPKNVELSLDYRTVMARLTIGAPVISFLAVPDPAEQYIRNLKVRLKLCLSDLGKYVRIYRHSLLGLT